MPDNWDIAVLGAGPAGGEAARVAAEGNLSVLLIDEQAQPGGQIWRTKDKSREDVSDTVETREGNRHREALKDSEVTFLGSARLWHIERRGENWHLHVLINGRSECHIARSVILAPGAREFVQPFSGWTTPGVYGLAGVTALMKSQQCPPGQRTVVAGGGPLAIFAAAEILRLGGQVAAVAIPNARMDWLRCLPLFAAHPAFAARGAELILRLKRANVPLLWRHVVTRAAGEEVLTSVQLSPCDAGWAPIGQGRELLADTLCVGHGLVPNMEVAALAGLALTYDEALGVWIAPTGYCGETALPGLFLCGDGAVLRGAETARRKGRLAGTSAVLSLEGREPRQNAVQRPVRGERFGKAMTDLATPRPGLVRLTKSDTIVCRCENLTRNTLDVAIDAGAGSLGALKSATRCGMGPCGGRYCMTAAARLISERTGTPPENIYPPTPRPPLFPLPAGSIGTGFEYDDLPIPEPAPL